MEPIVLTDEELRIYHRLRLKLIEDEWNEQKRLSDQLGVGKKKDSKLVQSLVKARKASMASLEREHNKVRESLATIPTKPGQPTPIQPTKP